jgi:DNA-binding NarL/FixJ family response regulator
VCADTGDADEAVALVAELHPDVVVMDVRFGPGATSGIEAARAIHAAHPDVGVVMLTSFHDDDALFAAIGAGVGAFVLKDLDGGELVSAIRQVAAGGAVLDPAVLPAVLDRLRRSPGLLGDDRLDRLSPRELDILAMVASGHTNREIGERLHLSEKTVKNHVTHVLAKLGATRRSEAASYYTRHVSHRA